MHVASWIDSFTDDDDQWDIYFILWCIGVVAFLGLELWIVGYEAKQPWDPLAFGTGFGLAMTAGGVMSKLRKS